MLFKERRWACDFRSLSTWFFFTGSYPTSFVSLRTTNVCCDQFRRLLFYIHPTGAQDKSVINSWQGGGGSKGKVTVSQCEQKRWAFQREQIKHLGTCTRWWWFSGNQKMYSQQGDNDQVMERVDELLQCLNEELVCCHSMGNYFFGRSPFKWMGTDLYLRSTCVRTTAGRLQCTIPQLHIAFYRCKYHLSLYFRYCHALGPLGFLQVPLLFSGHR